MNDEIRELVAEIKAAAKDQNYPRILDIVDEIEDLWGDVSQ
jgi:hypothetical protein